MLEKVVMDLAYRHINRWSLPWSSDAYICKCQLTQKTLDKLVVAGLRQREYTARGEHEVHQQYLQAPKYFWGDPPSLHVSTSITWRQPLGCRGWCPNVDRYRPGSSKRNAHPRPGMKEQDTSTFRHETHKFAWNPRASQLNPCPGIISKPTLQCKNKTDS